MIEKVEQEAEQRLNKTFEEDNPRNMNSRCSLKKAFSISSMEKTRKIFHPKLGSA